MAITQAVIIQGQIKIVSDMNANFDEIVRLVDLGN